MRVSFFSTRFGSGFFSRSARVISGYNKLYTVIKLSELIEHILFKLNSFHGFNIIYLQVSRQCKHTHKWFEK